MTNETGGTLSFNPNRLSAVKDSPTKEHAAHEGTLLGESLLPTVPVDDGESVDENLGCVVMVARVDDADKTFGEFRGTTVPVDLEYEKSGDTTVNMVREDTNTGFTVLQSPSPEVVQKECSEGTS